MVWINKIPALVQIMAWHRPVAKPLPEPMMVSLPTHICITWPQWVKDVCSRTITCVIYFCLKCLQIWKHLFVQAWNCNWHESVLTCRPKYFGLRHPVWVRTKCHYRLTVSNLHMLIISSPTRAAYMRQWIRSTLSQIMACCPFSDKPLSKPILRYCLSGPLGTDFSEILTKIQNFSFTKMFLNTSSLKWRPICPGVELRAMMQYVNTRFQWVNGTPATNMNSMAWLNLFENW